MPLKPPPHTPPPLPYGPCSSPEGMLLSLLIQPRASRNAFAGIHNGKLKITLTSPPVDNQANEALCQLLAQAFNLRKTHIHLLSGQTSRHKKVLLLGPFLLLAERLEKLLSTKLAPNFRL
ncbi:MAG: DUF167 domain-containing protein [Proteobacteria bacterium]|nr:DUF167 domain-containing protein [Cystobacterineae bacterium]MCL2259080.1 DUF167 domain-containing protein [Cystobacterineae bacterium]MCL2314361.1 DUF167 domain-containing protein [Pseudomonadota bacterium]